MWRRQLELASYVKGEKAPKWAPGEQAMHMHVAGQPLASQLTPVRPASLSPRQARQPDSRLDPAAYACKAWVSRPWPLGLATG